MITPMEQAQMVSDPVSRCRAGLGTMLCVTAAAAAPCGHMCADMPTHCLPGSPSMCMICCRLLRTATTRDRALPYFSLHAVTGGPVQPRQIRLISCGAARPPSVHLASAACDISAEHHFPSLHSASAMCLELRSCHSWAAPCAPMTAWLRHVATWQQLHMPACVPAEPSGLPEHGLRAAVSCATAHSGVRSVPHRC